MGGKTNGIVSRVELWREMKSCTKVPGRQVWAHERGAHVFSMRGALEGLIKELVSCGQFLDRHVMGPCGAPVPHTIIFRSTPELPHQLHPDSSADIHVCLALDKRGRGTATAKLVKTTPSPERPMARRS